MIQVKTMKIHNYKFVQDLKIYSEINDNKLMKDLFSFFEKQFLVAMNKWDCAIFHKRSCSDPSKSTF